METGSAYLAQEVFKLLPLEEIEKELAEDQLNSRGGCLITMPCMPVNGSSVYLPSTGPNVFDNFFVYFVC